MPRKDQSQIKERPVTCVLKFLSSRKLDVHQYLPMGRAGSFDSFSFQFSERSEDVRRDLTLLRNLLSSRSCFQQGFPLDLEAHIGFETPLPCSLTGKTAELLQLEPTQTLYLPSLS